jgi:hypothetical protein
MSTDNVKPLYTQPEHPQAEVTFKYYLPEHSGDVFIHTNASKMYSLLWDLDQKCRTVLKYEENVSGDKQKFAEDIRSMIWDEINLDEGNR